MGQSGNRVPVNLLVNNHYPYILKFSSLWHTTIFGHEKKHVAIE